MLSNTTSSWLKPLSALLTLSVMSGCAHDLTGVDTVSEYCRIAEPITYDSEADTPETVRQIEKHNSQWACVCESDCPKPEDR